MIKEYNFFIFTLDGHYFALDIAEIVRVYPALAIECPSERPPILCGLLTVAGKNIPVLDLRYRLHLPAREVQPDDALVVACSQGSKIGFFVDEIIGVRSFTEDRLCDSSTIYPEMAEYVSRITEVDEHTIWIYTLDLLFADQDFSALLQSVSAGVIS